MKSIILFITSIIALSASAEKVWYSADTLPLLGKGIDAECTAKRYQRLPDSLATKVKRDAVYYLGTQPAGMAIRFKSDAPAIDVKWKSLYNVVMNHMTPTGIRGLDLYTLEPDSSWTFVNTARPDVNSLSTSTTVIANMDPEMREYMLYLPLYDGCDSLYIGIDDNYSLLQPSVALPQVEKPIVIYGTSLLQGGCASRAGMAHSNILQRRLNREVINFGFSGNGQLDLEVAEVLAAVPDPAMYMLDFVPNVTDEQIDTLMIPFVEILEAAHPGIPILFAEDPQFPHTRFDKKIADEVSRRNALMKDKYKELTLRYPNLYYIANEDYAGHDYEAWVDAIHYTDLGFLRYSDLLEPVLRKIIGISR